MLTLVAVLLHPPILHPSFSLCYLLCCSLFILCSGKDLPWSHWCCLHKRQNSIWWCKALWRHHRMFFWGKIRGKKRMMRRPASLLSLSFNASSCISLISICYWTKSEWLLAWCVVKKNPPWYANDLSQNLLIKRQAKMWFCMQWIISIEHSQKHIQIICVTFYIASIGH